MNSLQHVDGNSSNETLGMLIYESNDIDSILRSCFTSLQIHVNSTIVGTHIRDISHIINELVTYLSRQRRHCEQILQQKIVPERPQAVKRNIGRPILAVDESQVSSLMSLGFFLGKKLQSCWGYQREP